MEDNHFYTSNEVEKLISETENIFAICLEGGDKARAMKKLRVPPLGGQVSQSACTHTHTLYRHVHTCTLHTPTQLHTVHRHYAQTPCTDTMHKQHAYTIYRHTSITPYIILHTHTHIYIQRSHWVTLRAGIFMGITLTSIIVIILASEYCVCIRYPFLPL